MKRLDIIGLIFGITGIIVMLWFLISIIPEHLNIHYDVSLEKASNIGDFIGGVIGVLFSIAAFLLLYETLNIQRVEISENKSQFQKQAFENNFFQMINMHNDFVKEFDIQKGKTTTSSEELKGCEIIAIGRDSFKFIWKNDFNKNIIRSKILEKEYINSKFDDLLLKWNDDLSHYFKHSVEILRYIHTSSSIKIIQQENQYYAKLFNSGLSTSEEGLFFYYIIFKGDVEIKKIIRQFDFFKNIQAEQLLDPKHLNWIYE